MIEFLVSAIFGLLSPDPEDVYARFAKRRAKRRLRNTQRRKDVTIPIQTRRTAKSAWWVNLKAELRSEETRWFGFNAPDQQLKRNGFNATRLGHDEPFLSALPYELFSITVDDKKIMDVAIREWDVETFFCWAGVEPKRR